jgi:hypothetical protein
MYEMLQKYIKQMLLLYPYNLGVMREKNRLARSPQRPRVGDAGVLTPDLMHAKYYTKTFPG